MSYEEVPTVYHASPIPYIKKRRRRRRRRREERGSE